MNGFYNHITLRYLKSRRGIVSVVTGFSLVGITLGVAALIVVMAVMAGFREELLSRILGVTGHGIVTGTITYDDSKNYREQLLKVEGITDAKPFVYGQGMIISGRNSSGILVRGVDLDDKHLFESKMIEGDVNVLADDKQVIIGNTLAKKLGVGVGDGITVLSPQGSHTVMGFIPRLVQKRVGGIFDIGMHQYDSALVYTSISSAQRFYKLKDRISAIDIKVVDPDNINSYRPYIAEIVGNDAFFQDWMSTNRQFFSALQVEKAAMFIILALVVIVAAFNIITGQTMLVNDKTGDIAILRTMGARRRDIMNIFLINGLILGGAGTVLGLVTGLLVVHFLQPIVSLIETLTGASIFSGEVYFLDSLPAVLVPEDIAMIIGLSIVLTILASLYPAWRAAKMDPVEVLRHE